MAIRSLLTRLQLCSLHEIRTNRTASFLRDIPSNILWASSFHDLASYRDNDIDIKSKLLSLMYPRRSAIIVLQNWVSEGQKVSIYDLREISKLLIQRGRYKHALEVMKWMEGQQWFQVSASDHALRLELTIKAGALAEAEDYFSKLPNISSQKASYLHLLNSYVKQKATKKAESLMIKMNSIGANVTPHPFNSMMKLYILTSQFSLVLSFISQMKQSKIPLNVLSYNLWMTASNEIHGVKHVNTVYKEMINDKNVKIGWSSLCTLANIYMKSGLTENANLALQEAETKLSSYNHFGYFFLITSYTSLKNKDGVVRVWEACKRVSRKLTCANYMCIMLCFVKLGDVEEAGRVFVEWESRCVRYDVRVSNILLGCYVRDNLMEKAEALHVKTMEKGGCPNYKTWEILMEGYLRNGSVEKVVFAMKNAFRMLKSCDWRPSCAVVEAVLECLERSGSLEDGMWFLEICRDLKLANLQVYQCLMRMCVTKGKGVDEIVRMMRDDEIDMEYG